MNRRIPNLAWLVLAVGLVSVLSASCSDSKKKNNASAANRSRPVKVETAPDPNVVEVSHPGQFPLVKAETRKVPNQVVTNGAVTWDVSRAVPVNSIAGGRVLDIKARLGDDVRQGQVLLVIDSPDFALALADYRKATSTERLAQKAYDRNAELYEYKAVALKELHQAEEDLQKAKVDRETAAEKIRIIGSTPDQPSPVVQVKAPVTGIIVEQNTTRGAAIKSLDNSPPLFTIADLSHVWVLCDLYENNLADVKLGDYAEVRLNAYPDHPLKGRVSNISRVLDPATRTAKVRLELDNRQGLLRPGMFASVRFTSRSEQVRTVVPMSAILRLNDKSWVFRSDGERRFRRAEVQTGPSLTDGLQQILGGLNPGDTVIENALQFASEANQRDSK